MSEQNRRTQFFAAAPRLPLLGALDVAQYPVGWFRRDATAILNDAIVQLPVTTDESGTMSGRLRCSE